MTSTVYLNLNRTPCIFLQINQFLFITALSKVALYRSSKPARFDVIHILKFDTDKLMVLSSMIKQS